MTVVPITFEDIHNYLVEEERIVCKSIKFDDSLKKLLKKNGIKLKDNELKNILDAINKKMKRKYRIGLFLKQTRFQAIKQVIELERENRANQVEKLNDVNNILDIISDDLKKATGNNNEIFDLLNFVEELPDSNLVNTNDVELIAMFDDVREKLLRNIKKYKKLNKDVKALGRIEEKLKSRKSLIEDQPEDVDNEIKQEIERMRYLLALNQ